MKLKRTVSLMVMVIVIAVAVAQAPFALAQDKQKRAITFDDLISMHRVGEPQISPDGKWVAYSVATPDMQANRNARNLWLVATSGSEAPRQITRSGRDSHPRWSPDGKRIAFISTRDGGPQIYVINVEGGEATKLTNISTGASEVTWSPDGKWLAFASEVFIDCKDDACNKQRDEELEKSKVKARVYDRLLYRHWDTWMTAGKRSHIFVVEATAGAIPRDLIPGADYDVPVVQRGGPVHFSWSPDGKEIAFNAVVDKNEAWVTNGEILIVPVAGGAAKTITTNTGFDSGPVYSPDGTYIAYRAQSRNGFEADRWRLMLYNRSSGAHTSLTEKWDRSVEDIAWSPDSMTIYFNAEDRAQLPVFSISVASPGEPRRLIEGFNGEFNLSRDGRTIVYSRASSTAPAELYAAASDGSGSRQITKHNAERLAQLDLPAAEHFWFAAEDGTQVQGMLLRPPNFDPKKKYPVLVIMHGGPQTQFGDSWSYRWNSQLLCAPGYVGVMINRRGSTGFGMKFAEEVSGDWGGRAFTDLMKGVDYALAKYPFADGSRMAAAGGSYGGYMAAWMASQAKGRFDAIIAHAAVYDLESMYGATEELWFPEWEFGGPPWDPKSDYAKWSPHKFAAEFAKHKTPVLVIHGEQDYRVPYTQGLELFTALQRQGVPSRLLLYPDEGHWILKPQNSQLWYREFHAWLEKYLK